MQTDRISKELGKLAADTIRLLAADGVQKANSGHPGMPMGMADCAFVLWSQYLKFNPKAPDWPNRDRFILSAGHGSMLLYSLLHLAQFDVTLDDLKSFRQWGSRTPGHPEVGCLPGVETTTGPLGQGFTNGVGMAIAAKMSAARYNKEGMELFGTHKIYGIVSDGDLMEGVSSEAASLAGHLKLGNIIYFYDDNHITIEGVTEFTFTESVQDRFNAYGWHTLKIDGHDQEQIAKALQSGINETEKPTLIIARTHIGMGSPNKHDTSEVHGSPLGEDELEKTRAGLGFPADKKFYVPEEVYDIFKNRMRHAGVEYEEWTNQFVDWKTKNPDLAAIRQNAVDKIFPDDLEMQLISALPEKTNATRSLSGAIIQKIAELCPAVVGGSADLDPSTKTWIKAAPGIEAGKFEGRNFHFGIREHAMGSINNGITLYDGFIPFGATFLVFADYMRPPIRLAAIMKAQNICVFTHDSIFVGEDGPTHQPVEQLASLRAIPNVQVMRPADGIETAVCWAMALRKTTGPSILLLTRQNVPSLNHGPNHDIDGIKKGAYIIGREKAGDPEIVILASGSEVSFALEAKKLLEEKSRSVRVVSVPCKELFESQSEAYQREIIPTTVKHLAVVEAGVSFGWKGYFELPLLFIGMNRFGESAPYKVLEQKFGFNGPSIAQKIEEFIG